MLEFLIQAALRSSIILGLGAVLWPLVPSTLPVWRRRLVLGFVIALLLVPLLPSVVSVNIVTLNSTSGPQPRLSLGQALAWIWLSGSIMALIRLAWQAWSLRRLWSESRSLGEVNLGGFSLEMRESDMLESPCVTGWRRPVLLVPSGSAHWNQQCWDCVLWHEREHALRRDPAALWLLRLTAAVYWWHPLVHLAVRQFHIESEATCDAAVLRAGNSPRAYVETLLSFTPNAPIPALSMMGTSPLRRRIQRFLQLGASARFGRLRVACGVVVALAIVGFSTLCGIQHPLTVPSLEQEAALRLSADPFPASDEAEGSAVGIEGS